MGNCTVTLGRHRSMDEVVGEIVAINEEISEFAAQGENVQSLIAERAGLVQLLEQSLCNANKIKGMDVK